jgi:hypothetical protein
MLPECLLAGVVVLSVLTAVPLPYSEEGSLILHPGEGWNRTMDLSSAAHVTYIVRSTGPVDITVVKGINNYGNYEKGMNPENGTLLYRFTERLEPGTYRLVVINQGEKEIEIEFQMHSDFIVIANMTAKNVMALSLALAIVVTALLLHWRSRRK